MEIEHYRLRARAMACASSAVLLLAAGGLLTPSQALARQTKSDQAIATAKRARTPPKPATANKPKAAQAAAASQNPSDNETHAVDEVVVTGVLAAGKARAANIAYTSLSQQDIDRFTPINAEDMLSDIPGVFVETNDGVARGEVYTRGMTVGTGTNTTGYFWTSLNEDGLPVVPQKFSGFQDGYFYRADISTGKVESVRGGSTATTPASSVGGAFNFISRDVRPGGSLQLKIGFEGVDSHLSWKQWDGYYGWKNKSGDMGFALTGFYRTGTADVDPGYKLNHGFQVKGQGFKYYDIGDWGSGKLTLYVKHLDDTNNVRTNISMPAYGFSGSPEPVDGWGRGADGYIKGGLHTIYLGPDETIEHDPQGGHRYRSDAITLRWEHNLPNNWRFENSIKAQMNRVDSSLGYSRDLATLNTRSNFEQLGIWNGAGNSGLLFKAGTFTLYDVDSGAVRATVANNLNTGALLGTNYRTGAACGRPSNNTTSTLCITSSNLPNRDFDVRGGLVHATNPARPATYLVDKDYPPSGTSTDLIMTTRGDISERWSKDLLGNMAFSHRGEHLTLTAGLYWDYSKLLFNSYGAGQGISAWADGQIRNLGIRFTDTNGVVYQVTDSGGWTGSGMGVTEGRATYRELSPYLGFQWSPTERWDINASYKYTDIGAKTWWLAWTPNSAYAKGSNTGGTPVLTTANYATYKDQTFGGIDGNPLTVYDNLYYVRDPSLAVQGKKGTIVRNYTVSVGFNFTPTDKVYYRFTDGKQSVQGLVNRFQNAASLGRDLGPTASLWQHEVSFSHRGRIWSPTITYFYSRMGDPYSVTGYEANNVDRYQTDLLLNTYFTRGVEVESRLRINRHLSINSAITYNNGKNTARYLWSNVDNANGLGRSDDTLQLLSSSLTRVSPWLINNTIIFTYKDVALNLRQRYVDDRRTSDDPLNTTTLPARNIFDFSAQYVGFKNTRLQFEVRNLTNDNAISAIGTLVRPNLTDVQAYDVMQQLPNSASGIKTNAPRSFWLTIKHDF